MSEEQVHQIKTKKSDFKLFQDYFERYQRLFGLNGYKVYFKHEPIDGAFASIAVNQRDMVVTVRLNDDKDTDKNIKQSAKHEALHLLLFRLEHRACDRYAQADEIYETVEDLVRRLEQLIPDIKEG